MKNPVELILYPSKLKNIFLIIISSIITLGGIWMIKDHEPMGFLVLFFVLGVPVGIMNSLPGAAYLKLTSEGFIICTSFTIQFTKWQEVSGFNVKWTNLKQAVVYKFTSKHSNYLPDKIIGNDETALLDNYGLSAKKLAVLMNEWRKKSIK
ncbi:MAG: hypothetical protein WCJ58_07875 [bacterium]